MSRSLRIQLGLAVLIVLSVLFLLSIVHTAAAAPRRTIPQGHRLAQAWCQSCHAIEPGMRGLFGQAPSFQSIADRSGTTALSLKVFWQTSHQTLPNLVISPDEAEALSGYILSLRRR